MYGGGPSVIHSLAGALRKLGVEIVLHDYWKHDPKQFDLIHYFSCQDSFNWKHQHADDPPLVVTPISWLEFSAARRLKESSLYAIRALLHRTSDRRALGYPFSFPAHFFPNSQGEADCLSSAYGVPREKMTIVPHGVSQAFCEGDATLFEREHGLSDFVLCVGRFEYPRKNQLALVQAMKDAKMPLVFIGGAEPGSQWYYDQCRREAGATTTFLPACGREDPMLISAYHACKVLAMPALLESPGLTGLEAALAGANLAVTKNGSTREYFGDHAQYFDPTDTAQMRASVLAAFESPRSAALKQRVLDQFTWPRIAAMQLRAYEKILI